MQAESERNAGTERETDKCRHSERERERERERESRGREPTVTVSRQPRQTEGTADTYRGRYAGICMYHAVPREV